MKRIQSIIVIVVMCVLGFVAYAAQNDSMSKLEEEEIVLSEVIETVLDTQQVLEEERLAEAEVTVGVLEAAMPQGLPEDKGYQIECPAVDVGEPIVSTVVNTNSVNLIMDERIPTEKLYTGADVDSFFADAIFVGDSVTVGLSNYYDKLHGAIFTDTTQFLAQVGCSAKMCISSNPTEKYQRFMPSYGGRLCRIEDGIALSGAKKVFIDYGLNDLTGSTANEFLANFTTLINRIQEKNPSVQIYVISTTYVVCDAQTGMLTNGNIRKANEAVKAYCQENGLGYINVADYIADEDGGLNPRYSSDQYVHQNSKSYEMWVKVLRHYAYLQTSTDVVS